MSGTIAQQLNGATVMLEHRFFGESNPYPNSTTQSLRVLTIQQAIDDLVYFSQTVDLPMKNGDQVKPHMVPWILVGGSYSGMARFFFISIDTKYFCRCTHQFHNGRVRVCRIILICC